MRLSLLASMCFVTLLLSACTTPYQEMGSLGGVQATQISSDTFQIRAQGNGYTDPDTIQRYALRKAAEVTISAGYDWFQILSDSNRTVTGATTSAVATSTRSSTYVFATTMPIIKPGQTVMIKLMKGAVPADASVTAFDAREILKFSTGTYVPPAPTK